MVKTYKSNSNSCKQRGESVGSWDLRKDRTNKLPEGQGCIWNQECSTRAVSHAYSSQPFNCRCRARSSIWLLVSIGYTLQLLPLETAPVQKTPGSVCIVSTRVGTHPCSQENVAPTALPTVVGNEEGKMVTRKKELPGRQYMGICEF